MPTTKYKYIGPEGNVFTVGASSQAEADARAQKMQAGAKTYSGSQLAGSTVKATTTATPTTTPTPTPTPTSTPTPTTPTSGYTGVSIVDYLKSVGQASDYTSRATLAAQKGITNYTGTAAQNTQLLGMLRGGATPTPTPTQQPTAESIQAGITALQERIKTEGITDASGKYLLEPEEVAPTVPTQTATYEPPPSTAVDTVSSYTQTLLAQEQKAREALEQRHQAELDKIAAEKETAQKRVDELTAKTEGIITEEVKPLLEPFRADLEKSERERLKVEENYFENQALVDELDTLLTQIQTDLQATKDITGLASIREPRISKATENAIARVGVIEAVMATRNNQINQAYTLIDRTTEAMTADRQDQLTYYSTLIDFYDKQKDEEGNKILTLESDQRAYISAQIGLLENDLAQAEANSNYIKSLMVNPETAQFMASAGITLNDTPNQVNLKMAEQSEREKVADFTNELTAKGYKYVPYTTDTTGLESYNVGGQTLWFKPPEEIEQLKTQVVEANGRKLLINTQTGETIQDLGMADSGVDEEEIGVTASAVRNWLLENKRANPDMPYYDLWGKLADEITNQGLNPSNYDKLFWEILHPEGLAGYDKYVKESGTNGVSNEDLAGD